MSPTLQQLSIDIQDMSLSKDLCIQVSWHFSWKKWKDLNHSWRVFPHFRCWLRMFILLPMDGMLHGMWELLRSKVCWPSELHDPTYGEGSDACLKILYREKLTAGSHTGSLKKRHSWPNLILFSKIAMRSGELDWLTAWIIACRHVHQ